MRGRKRLYLLTILSLVFFVGAVCGSSMAAKEKAHNDFTKALRGRELHVLGHDGRFVYVKTVRDGKEHVYKLTLWPPNAVRHLKRFIMDVTRWDEKETMANLFTFWLK